MNRNSIYCSNIKELSRYFHISYAKAIDLVNESSSNRLGGLHVRIMSLRPNKEIKPRSRMENGFEVFLLTIMFKFTNMMEGFFLFYPNLNS